MTVCVFDPHNGYCYVDSVTMRGNIYSNKMGKMYQWKGNNCVYTAMCSGTCSAVTFALDVVFRHITEGKLNAALELDRFKSAIGEPSENPFTITVVEFNTEAFDVRCFSYDNLFVPYEVQWFENEIVVNADPEIELALQVLYEWVHTGVDTGPATSNDVVRMISSLHSKHAYVSGRDLIQKTDITNLNPEYQYDCYKRRTFSVS